MKKPHGETLGVSPETSMAGAENEGRGAGSGHTGLASRDDFILRTLRGSLKGFEQGNDTIRFMIEETTGED